jgi:hypothetical protein
MSIWEGMVNDIPKQLQNSIKDHHTKYSNTEKD